VSKYCTLHHYPQTKFKPKMLFHPPILLDHVTLMTWRKMRTRSRCFVCRRPHYSTDNLASCLLSVVTTYISRYFSVLLGVLFIYRSFHVVVVLLCNRSDTLDFWQFRLGSIVFMEGTAIARVAGEKTYKAVQEKRYYSRFESDSHREVRYATCQCV